IDPLSPAATAGLKKGDIVRSIENRSPASVEEARELVQACAAGRSLRISVLRLKEKLDLIATLAAASRPLTGSGQRILQGVRTTEQDNGARVDRVFPGSPAADAGLKSGDVISKIDESSLGSSRQLSDVLNEKAPGSMITLVVQRDGGQTELKV